MVVYIQLCPSLSQFAKTEMLLGDGVLQCSCDIHSLSLPALRQQQLPHSLQVLCNFSASATTLQEQSKKTSGKMKKDEKIEARGGRVDASIHCVFILYPSVIRLE